MTPQAWNDFPDLTDLEEIIIDAWQNVARHRPVNGAGMGWIPLGELQIWFDLNGIIPLNRSWYYRGIMAVEAGYLRAKSEQAQAERAKHG